MIYRFNFSGFILAFMLASLVSATEVSTDEQGQLSVKSSELGELALRYVEPIAVDSYPGQRTSAQVTFKHGAAFTLVAPRRVQQVSYLVEVGTQVEKGQPIAELRGPEMHHFLTEMEAAGEMLANVEKRFKSNKMLYEKRAIKESQWIEISEKYYAAMLEYEHMRHFNDLVISVDPLTDLIVIGAPIGGIIDYAPDDSDIKPGDDIAILIPIEVIRLKASVSGALRKDLFALESSECSVDIASVGAVARGFLVTAWSEAIEENCDLVLGQTLLVTPLYRTRAYQVPVSSVFQWQQSSSIFIEKDGQLQVVAVELLASRGGDYIVRAEVPLEGGRVLVTSVSAVQGVLMGLGGE
ncbi:MAG: hypothetical protein V7754_06640 [Halioglobus sp.]